MNNTEPAVITAAKKHWPVLLAFVLSLVSCNFSAQALSVTGRDFLSTVSKFVLAHSNYFFAIIAVLLFLEIVLEIVRYRHDNDVFEQKIKGIESTQEQAIKDIKDSCAQTSSEISVVKYELLSHGKDMIITSQNQNHKVHICLKDIQTVHNINKIQYHSSHKKLYRIMLNSNANIEEQTKPLIQKYCEKK